MLQVADSICSIYQLFPTFLTEELFHRRNKLIHLLQLFISNFWIREDFSLEEEQFYFRKGITKCTSRPCNPDPLLTMRDTVQADRHNILSEQDDFTGEFPAVAFLRMFSSLVLRAVLEKDDVTHFLCINQKKQNKTGSRSKKEAWLRMKS